MTFFKIARFTTQPVFYWRDTFPQTRYVRIPHFTTKNVSKTSYGHLTNKVKQTIALKLSHVPAGMFIIDIRSNNNHKFALLNIFTDNTVSIPLPHRLQVYLLNLREIFYTNMHQVFAVAVQSLDMKRHRNLQRIQDYEITTSLTDLQTKKKEPSK